MFSSCLYGRPAHGCFGKQKGGIKSSSINGTWEIQKTYEKRLPLDAFEQFVTSSKGKRANDQCFCTFYGGSVYFKIKEKRYELCWREDNQSFLEDHIYLYVRIRLFSSVKIEKTLKTTLNCLFLWTRWLSIWCSIIYLILSLYLPDYVRKIKESSHLCTVKNTNHLRFYLTYIFKRRKQYSNNKVCIKTNLV